MSQRWRDEGFCQITININYGAKAWRESFENKKKKKHREIYLI